MSGRYSVEDLLRLRASPLIDKPSNLSDIQAIISAQAAQEPPSKRAPARNAKVDDALSPTEAFQKRPFLDGTSRKSASDPDRIVLGPPRRSFASSTIRANGKPGDGDEAIRDKDSQYDKAKGSDRFSDRRTNAKFARETEGDDKYARRRNEDGDERPRRPKWAQDDGDEKPPRSGKRFDQPWFRGDRAGEDGNKEGDNEWRRAGGRDRGWGGREVQTDQEPEWMDGDEDDSATPMKTTADLQRWMQMKKAKDLGIELPPEPPVTAAIPAPEAPAKTNLPSFFDEEADDSMDKFATRFTASSTQQQTTAKPAGKSRFGALFGPAPIDTQKSVTPEPGPSVMSAPPREAPSRPDSIQQMFGMPMREKMAPSPAAVAAAGPKSAGADNVDFNRIMAMLQVKSDTPPSQGPPNQPQSPRQEGAPGREDKPRVPLYARDSQQNAAPPGSGASPLHAMLQGQPQPRQSSAPQDPLARRSTGQDRFDMSKSPVDSLQGRQGGQKSELLLNMLRQAGQAPKPTPPPDHLSHRAMSTDHSNRMAMARNDMQLPPDMNMMRGYAQGPAEEGSRMRYSDEPLAYERLSRQPTNEKSRPMYDESFEETLRGPGSQGGPVGHSHGPPPPGLGRPPGFDLVPPRMPPPGWNNGPPHPQHNMQARQQQGPPLSSMPNSGRPSIPPGYGMPPRMQQGPPPSQDRDSRPPPQNGPQGPGPQRKYTGDGGMPMMGPPPGFMSNGPPPGFMGMPGGPGQQQQQQRGYPPMQSPQDQGPPGRGFMDMYNDMPGGGPGPGGPGARSAGVRPGVAGQMGGYR